MACFIGRGNICWITKYVNMKYSIMYLIIKHPGIHISVNVQCCFKW